MKSYTDLEQSKKLAEILPIESADHHYVRKVTDFMGKSVDGKWSTPKYGCPNSEHANYMVQNFTSYEVIPCWSLAALFEGVLPLEAEIHKQTDGHKIYYYVEIYTKEIYMKLNRMNKAEICLSTQRHENLIDACVEMILTLKEKDLL